MNQMKTKSTFVLFWLFATVQHLLGQANIDVRNRVLPIDLWAMYGNQCGGDIDQFVAIWEDKFDQGQLDRYFWNPDLLNFHHAQNGKETDEYNSEANLQFLPNNSGTLRIRQTNVPIFARGIDWLPDNEPFQSNPGEPTRQNLRTWPYQSGAITSRWGFSHGRYVLNAKIPSGAKSWPAFWLSGTCADEIDIFEFMQTNNANVHDRQISYSVHTKLNCSAQFQNIDTQTPPNGQIMSNDFHEYSVDWDDFMIVFKVDDDIKRTFFHYYKRTWLGTKYRYDGIQNCNEIVAGSTYVYDPQFVDAMMRIIVNGAIRNNATQSAFPRNFDLDYFGLYEPMDCQETKNIHTYLDIQGSNYYSSYGDRTVTAGNVVINPTSQIDILGPPQTTPWDPGDLLIITAADEIKILPGFDVERGGNLVCQISPCTNNKFISPSESLLVVDSPTPFFSDDSLFSNYAENFSAWNHSNDWSILPNPVALYSTCKVVGARFGDLVEVYTFLGSKLRSQTIDDDLLTFGLEGIPAGSYIIRVWRDSTPVYNSVLIIQ